MSSTAHGLVCTPDGWPVRGARLTLIDGSGQQLGRAITEADGSFQLDVPHPGPATLVVAAPGHDPAALPVAVPDGPWELGRVQLVRQGATNLPAPGLWVIDPQHSSIQAQSRHLGLATIRGVFSEFGGVVHVDERLEQSTTQVEITAASIDTGNRMRDDHLRSADFLDVARFPTLSYTGERVERRPGGLVVVGHLEMLGVRRPVELATSYQGSGPDPWGGTRAGFSASTTLRRDDFAMNWNMAVGLGIDALGSTLRVDIELETVKQEA